ncbi:unnamed protein product, partial [Phaeothamnion confervicola]
DRDPLEWPSCDDAYEHTWSSAMSDESLAGLSRLERLKMIRSMGYCPERRCQLGELGSAERDGVCPPGLCYTKLKAGAPTFGACCY